MCVCPPWLDNGDKVRNLFRSWPRASAHGGPLTGTVNSLQSQTSTDDRTIVIREHCLVFGPNDDDVSGYVVCRMHENRRQAK